MRRMRRMTGKKSKRNHEERGRKMGRVRKTQGESAWTEMKRPTEIYTHTHAHEKRENTSHTKGGRQDEVEGRQFLNPNPNTKAILTSWKDGAPVSSVLTCLPQHTAQIPAPHVARSRPPSWKSETV